MDGKRTIALVMLTAFAVSAVAHAQLPSNALQFQSLSAMPESNPSGAYEIGTAPEASFANLQAPFDYDTVTPASWATMLGGDKLEDTSSKDCVCPPAWAHRTGIFGELLYLRPRNSEVSYAVPFNGAVVPPGGVPVQVGPVGVASPQFDPGFRIGFTKAFDECSSVAVSYTRFQSSTDDTITQAPIRALVLHPGTANAAQNFLTASGIADVDYDLIDLDYRSVWNSSDYWAVNYLIGVRYARMDQDFSALFTQVGSADAVQSNINFEGLGLRLGLDGERHSDRGWLLYGRANVSLVAGEFGSSYLQGSTAQPVIVNTAWDGTRIVPILDLELGVGWQSECGRYRLTGGYLINAWLNAINSDNWIQGVQTNNFVDLSDSVTFDGFTARAEYRF